MYRSVSPDHEMHPWTLGHSNIADFYFARAIAQKGTKCVQNRCTAEQQQLHRALGPCAVSRVQLYNYSVKSDTDADLGFNLAKS